MDYNYLIKFTEIALNDIDNIYNYILRKNNKEISKKITDRIKFPILNLRNFQKTYPIYNIMKLKEYRKLIIDNWVGSYI